MIVKFDWDDSVRNKIEFSTWEVEDWRIITKYKQKNMSDQSAALECHFSRVWVFHDSSGQTDPLNNAELRIFSFS